MYSYIKKFEKYIRQKFFKKKKKIRFFRQSEKFLNKYPEYTIGHGSYCDNLSVSDWDEGTTLNIGSYCSISSNVQIFLGGHHRTDWVSTYPFPAFVPTAKHIKDYGGTNGDVIIGSDVWICANVTILSGVTVGHGAVLAGSSVVTRDVAPYSVVAGNPARHIKYRFSDEIVQKFLEVKWWNWPVEEVIENPDIFCTDSIDDFFVYAENRKK